MLARACDCRLPARLTIEDCDAVADVILSAVDHVMRPRMQATA
jgi:hypothetical protein